MLREMMRMSMLRVMNISHSYDTTQAVNDCTLTVEPAQRIAIIGPSGCGKSTLLRIIAGLEPGHTGSIWYQGRDITGVAAHQRGIGLMFQEHALFPHMTVSANVAYGLYGQPKQAMTARVTQLLELMGITQLAERLPEQLSGGERQRVALARSLAPKPALLLLDEPFAALDRIRRDFLLDELPTLLEHEQVAAIYVTHDALEACRFAEQIVVMQAGKIVRQDTPQQLYQAPQSAFVATLLGMRTPLALQSHAAGCHTAFGVIPLMPPQADMRLLIHPEAGIPLGNQPQILLEGRVTVATFRPPWWRLTLQSHDGQSTIECDVALTSPPVEGEIIEIAVRLNAMSFVADDV
jgi:ABC-type Fe3+/spermidine/putrescine transport system ATPase subunit